MSVNISILQMHSVRHTWCDDAVMSTSATSCTNPCTHTLPTRFPTRETVGSWEKNEWCELCDRWNSRKDRWILLRAQKQLPGETAEVSLALKHAQMQPGSRWILKLIQVWKSTQTYGIFPLYRFENLSGSMRICDTIWFCMDWLTAAADWITRDTPLAPMNLVRMRAACSRTPGALELVIYDISFKFV